MAAHNNPQRKGKGKKGERKKEKKEGEEKGEKKREKKKEKKKRKERKKGRKNRKGEGLSVLRTGGNRERDGGGRTRRETGIS